MNPVIRKPLHHFLLDGLESELYSKETRESWKYNLALFAAHYQYRWQSKVCFKA